MDIEFFIPFYGQADRLMQAIDCIRNLEDTRWRLTIVEDAYPGGEELEQKVCALGDDRVRYLRNGVNLGANANTYQCIQLAEWEYFSIVDPDDMVLPNYGKLVGGILNRNPGAAMVQPRVEVIDDIGRVHLPLPDRVKLRLSPSSVHEVRLHGERAARSLMAGNWLYVPALCMRRDALQRVPFRSGIEAIHDLAFVIDALLNGESLVMGNEIAFQYRRHSASHSSSMARNGERFEQERQYFRDIAEVFAQKGWDGAHLAARVRATSRLHALTQLPGTLKQKEFAIGCVLLHHIFAP